MTAVLPDVDTIAALDWKPACEERACKQDHPAATHVAVGWCGCSVLMCPDCAAILADLMDFLADDFLCTICGDVLAAPRTRLGDHIRIEAL